MVPTVPSVPDVPSPQSLFGSTSRIPEELLHLVENFAFLGGFLLEAALPGIQFIDLLFQPFNIFGQAPDRLGDWIGEIGRVKVDNRTARRCMLRLVLYDSARNADHRGVRRHRSHQHGASSHPAMATNGHRTEDRRAAKNSNRVLDRGVTLDTLRRRTTERDPLVDRHIIADFGCLTDDNTHPVVDKKAPTDFGAWMDLDACKKTAHVAHETRQGSELALP